MGTQTHYVFNLLFIMHIFTKAIRLIHVNAEDMIHFFNQLTALCVLMSNCMCAEQFHWKLLSHNKNAEVVVQIVQELQDYKLEISCCFSLQDNPADQYMEGMFETNCYNKRLK